MTVSITHSPSGKTSEAKLSVLIPFFKDDATDLLKALDRQSVNQTVEILIYDDGTNDPALTEAVSKLVQAAEKPVRLLTNTKNLGRSGARNALFEAAQADWVLFLDADMRPSRDDFLQNYLTLIGTSGADVIFGGFKVETSETNADLDLHRALSEVSDCLSLADRQAAGPQYVASSNLCVRTAVLRAEAFDSGFKGWGWEDSEWAARISKRFKLLHADNAAIHLGLETTETLLNRFASSGQNYRRFTDAHPDLAANLDLYRISKKLRKLPGQAAMRPVLRAFVKTHALPLKARLTALKLWRASHYADALS